MLERFLEALGMLVFLWACWAFLRFGYHYQARKRAKGQKEIHPWSI